MVMPNSYAGALNLFVKNTGFAAAGLAGSQIMGGFISSFLVALFPERTQTLLAIILVLSSMIIIVANRYLIHTK